MYASGYLRQTQTTLLSGVVMLLALAVVSVAEDVNFSVYCEGSASQPGAQPDSFAQGPYQQKIAKNSDTRIWTPNKYQSGPFQGQDLGETAWTQDVVGSWWRASSVINNNVPTVAESKSRAGYTTNGTVYDPRVQWSKGSGGTGHAFAWAGSGSFIIIPNLGSGGFLGIQNGVLGVEGSQWTTMAVPTMIELEFPTGTPFQLDVVVAAEVRYPENIAHVMVDVIVDGAPIASGFAELGPGGMLYQGGVLAGVFTPPTYEPGEGELFGNLELELVLPDGWRVVRELDTDEPIAADPIEAETCEPVEPRP
ncbi:MAG: hypothetical protein KKB50_15500 [Planctomycetes bacterium]|nr:hypothetical protein [Planctomycetota bacterium]